MSGDADTTAALHRLRESAPPVLGAVARRCGDFDAAEDAVQEALIAASTQWPAAGVPSNPRGWLYQVAMRRLADQARSDASRRAREERVAEDAPFVPPPDSEIGADRDDTLALLFMCAHPALTPSSAIALTLRVVGGLTTAEIAAAFLVPEATMAQRISRAKQNIKASGVGFEMPGARERAARLSAVLHVLYLMFNEGYTSTAGPSLQRVDLSDEAIRLARMLHALRPDEGEAAGLLALMLLTDARRSARTGANGELIPLDEQDRARWNRAQIAEGTALTRQALTSAAVGLYQLQAAVAALHDEAPGASDTDWREIESLYARMTGLTDNPMVALNHAIAVAMVEGPEAGLARLTELEADSRIAGHYRLAAVRGHLYETTGDAARAAAHFRAAADGTANEAERNYLVLKAASLQSARR